MATHAVVADKPSVWLKMAHGSGAAAFGIKNNGFDYFLLFFYGTVVGLEPGLVGLAILIALVLDAISDPLVGYWSDNFRSRWGRRHPFMYASALPVALSYFLLWNPPVGVAANVVYAIAANLPCILAQRYNRPRVLAILERHADLGGAEAAM